MVIGSFTGNDINPIVDARLAKSLSANALSKRLGLSRQYLSRAEQGTYSSLNPALLKWTANALSIGTADVMKLYTRFQRETRRATVDKVGPHKLSRNPGNNQPGHVIFEHWRSGYWPSTMAFATAFCIHPDTIQKYEEGIRLEMPSPIRLALREVGLIEDNWWDTISKQTV